jgi:hypothetical protein
MKAVEPVRELGVAQALMKGTCPICALVREFQNNLIETLAPDAAKHLCNFHAWAVAHATPAKSVISIFSRLLDAADENSGSGLQCDVCWRMGEEEEVRVREMAKELRNRATLLDWMLRHGSLCRNHAIKLRAFLPVRLQNTVKEIVERNVAEMKQEMNEYRQHLEQGIHEGGGLLGKVAEFLVSQRGITR